MNMKPPKPLPQMAQQQEQAGPTITVQLSRIINPDGSIQGDRVNVMAVGFEDTMKGSLATSKYLCAAANVMMDKALSQAEQTIDGEKPRVILPPAGLRLQN